MVIVAILVALFLSATRIATFLTELWWFDSLGFRGVFTGILSAQILLGVVFGVTLALLVGVNLVFARRMRPIILPTSPREAVIERYRQLADPYVPWLIVVVALLFALSAGGAAASQWHRFLLWRNGELFGRIDEQFGRDVGFYVFSLPWLDFVQEWLFTSLILALLVTAGAHYLLGSIRPEAPRNRVTPQAKGHLSVLLALVLAARAWGYWLERFKLNFSQTGQVTGASYTDIHAELPMLHLLLIASAVAIVLVLWNIQRRGWLLPGIALGLLLFVSILRGAYPQVIQRLRVEPQELVREQPFIERNLAATRTAYGLDAVDSTRFVLKGHLTPAERDANAVTLNNVRLWDTNVLETTYKQLQAIRPYYDFHDVDVDRYRVGNELRQVMISVRELFTDGLEEQARTWQNLHLTYTHGYGVVSSRVSTSTPEGAPVFLVRDIPPRADVPQLLPQQPAIYYGEQQANYVVVGTQQPEFDYESSDTREQRTSVYATGDGVAAGGLRRLAFALRFADPNLMLSGLIDSDSRILFHRPVRERVQQVAPFLTLDQDPYPVVLDGKILWVVDGYTTSAYYPYSERRRFQDRQTVNYVRNSVKAVVDAYTGAVTLYVTDPTDPIVNAWQKVFPQPFAPMSAAPPELQAHFRYPEDLFRLQSDLYTTYHIPDAPAFYSKADAWEIPEDAAAIANAAANPGTQMRPYYLLMRLPGQPGEEFVLIQPYKALGKPNMISWLAGRSDPGKLGGLFAVQFPSDQAILGPSQAQAKLEQNPTVSEWITLRDQRGSRVIRGNLIIIPIQDSILYVEPLFLQNEQARIPELAQVVLILGDNVAMDSTFERALAKLIGAPVPPAPGATGPGTPGPGGPAGPSPEVTLDQLISQALEKFAAADSALRQGDLAGYQRSVQEARALLQRAADQRGVPARPAPGAPGAPAAPGTPAAPAAPAPGATPSPARTAAAGTAPSDDAQMLLAAASYGRPEPALADPDGRSPP